MTDYAGNTLGTARSLTITSTTQTFNDSVGPLDTNDYYRFSISSRSSFNLNLNGLTADADVYLLNSSGQNLQTSVQSGITAESIKATLDVGTYYVRVSPYYNSTNYNLSLSATSMVDSAGNTTSAARNISVGSTSSTYSDWVGSSDKEDYYKFTLSNNYNFKLTLNGLSADADVQLLRLNSNGSTATVATSATGGTAAEAININALTAGNYFVRVYSYTGNTNYNLSLSSTPLPISTAYESNNTLSAAYNLGSLSGTKDLSAGIGGTDTNDYYKFSIGTTSSFSLSMTGMSANADVQLLNSSGAAIVSSANTGTTNESISPRNLSAGTYYLRVYPASGSTNYNLSLIGVDASYEANNTLTTAYNLGNLSGTKNLVSGIGSTDTNDYYKFTFGSTSNFSLSMTGMSANADVQLLNSSGAIIASSLNTGTANESISPRNLSAGTYFVRVYSASGSTNYNASLSTTIDWFSQNIKDSGLQSAARERFTDGTLDRNDMIAVLRAAKDSSVVDATELTDLRNLVSNASYLKLPDYVKVLSNKVVNGNSANQKYQGVSLGNLYAGSSDTQMENLISKWFVGSDRPTTSYTYQYASGSLFQGSISVSDVKQGFVGDCYFLAGLAATALRASSTIGSMFIDNGDNTYTVRFYNNGVADFVTVDRYLPTDSSGTFVYANMGGSYNNSSNELWVALAEKAYAQLNESGWIGQDNTNSYEGISSGYISDAFAQITGRSSSLGNTLDFTLITNAVNSGKLVGLATNSSGVASNIVPNHAYVVTGYNSSTQKFSLFNPWGVNGGYDGRNFKPGTIELTWSEITANFSYWDSTTT